VGRFNLYDLVDDTAVVGYRVAQHVAGRGVATTGLRDLCRVASEDLRLRTLKALTTKDNVRRSECWRNPDSSSLDRRRSRAETDGCSNSP